MRPVRYALLQQTLDPPGIGQLKRAFTAVRCLVDSDAHGVANDAFGILVRDLELGDAQQLQGALRTEGVDTEMLPVSSLPAIPPTKYVRRVEFGPDVLLIYDPIGRPVPVEWRHLMLIAAGSVVMSRMSRRTVGGAAVADLLMGSGEWGLGGIGGRARQPTERSEMREERTQELTLELVLTNGVARFSLMADGSAPVLFRCLGGRQSGDSAADFQLLVSELARLAPQAMLNRGAWSLRQTPPLRFGYPSKNAFFEEIIWMLHRAKRAQGG
jgi:hypothetical protein